MPTGRGVESLNMITGTWNNGTMEVTIDSNMHPLYIHNNDHRLILSSTHLTGSDNFSTWQRSLQIYLSAKNKLDLIDGSFPTPDKGSSLYALWMRANDMIIAWNFNTVESVIACGMSHLQDLFGKNLVIVF